MTPLDLAKKLLALAASPDTRILDPDWVDAAIVSCIDLVKAAHWLQDLALLQEPHPYKGWWVLRFDIKSNGTTVTSMYWNDTFRRWTTIQACTKHKEAFIDIRERGMASEASITIAGTIQWEQL